MDRTLYHLQAEVFALAIVAGGLFFLVARLRKTRPELSIGRPVAAALTLRVFAAIGVSLSTVASSLRGGDERVFLDTARYFLAPQGIGSDASLDWLTSHLHVWLFALQIRLDFPETALRITHLGLAVCGLTLLAVAVHDLAGPRAGTLAAWLLALEPTGVFFSSLLHKESLMFLAAGLVAFGGTKIWTARDFRGLAPMVAGCLIAVATRPYVGWFLMAATAAVILHGSLKGGSRRRRGLMVAMIVASLVAAGVPTILEASSPGELKKLQVSQDANTADDANLALEPVNYSSRGEIVTNLPKRVRDILIRPYPWQFENLRQQLGLVGTLVVLLTLFLLTRELWRMRGQIAARAGPLLYPAFFLVVAYALSAGNAGTAFRYRTVLVALLICLVAALRERAAVVSPELTGDGAARVEADGMGVVTAGRNLRELDAPPVSFAR